MADSFDAFEYLSYLRSKWRFIALVCGVALAIATGAGLLLPKKYTATAKIVIEPPGGGDQRVAVAISPIYLESLRTYEHFASSDSLFLHALEHFGLRREAENRPVEAWKRSVLKVEIPRNTKILEISAKLPDPKKAQAMALYLAQETVNLSRTVKREGGQDLVQEAQRQAAEARARLDRASAEYRRAAASEPVEGLEDEIESAEALRADLRRRQTPADMLKLRDLDREISRKKALAGERTAHADILYSELKEAQGASTAAERRLQDVRTVSAYGGEQLYIIDPGITPERPSSPNVPLIALAALLAGLTASLVLLSFEFNFARQKRRFVRPPLRAAAHDA